MLKEYSFISISTEKNQIALGVNSMYDSGTYLNIGVLCKVRNEQDNILNSKSLSLGVVLPIGNNTQFITF